MILGIGSDLVRIQRIRTAMERFGERFLQRIYSPQELAFCQVRQDPAPCLAKRFAAKEAFVKALGSGFRDGIWFRDVEVVNDAFGRPCLAIHGPAATRMTRIGITHIHLSISDESGFALAFVVVEKMD
ncbi:MAG: holo-ACP synthase [Magnetococcus sp. DMHC-1]|nr:holo-ACP synthase [Magnetococcales bacterium]